MKLTNLFNLKKRHRRAPRANAFVLESLEPRLMLSATPMTPVDVTHDHVGHSHVESAVICISDTMGNGGSNHSHRKPGANGWRDDLAINCGISTTTTLTSSAATSIYGDAVTFTARVTAADGAARPVGSVEFFDGTRSLGIDDTASRGSRSTAIFTISVSNFTAGTHAIHAVFTGGTGREPEWAGSERHNAHEHRDLHRPPDDHRHDGGPQENHWRGHHEWLEHLRYKSSTSGNLEQTVSQKSLTASFTVANKTYDGTTTATVQTQTLAGVIASDDVSMSGGTAAFVDANVGSNKTVTLTGATLGGLDASNYSLTSVNTTSANIAKANATLVLTGYYGTYDGAAHEATGTATGVNGEDLSAGLDLSVTSHTNANAGVYIDAVTFTDVTGNYKNTLKNAKSTIKQANAVISLTGYYGTYDGSSHQATGTATGVLGEDLSGLNMSVTSHTNAGVYIDTVTFTDVTGNYKNTLKNVKSTINQANAVITVTGYDVIYDGLAHTATGTATGVNGEDLSAGLDLSSTTHSNVGTYLDVVTFTDVTGNYKNTVKNVSSRIL
ncbi:MAG: Ig-like domain repeat protein [Nitrospirae bacterium]|nr:Ig-like domain repeat protein [Nitrospirota bacterium]